jgi:putative ABC transport system ATP-binding protein
VANDFVFDEGVVQRGDVRALDGVRSAHTGPRRDGPVRPFWGQASRRYCGCAIGWMPTAGQMCFRGQDTAGLDALPLRRKVGMVFQRPTPFPGRARQPADRFPGCRPRRLELALAGAALEGSWLDRDATPCPEERPSGCASRAPW